MAGTLRSLGRLLPRLSISDQPPRKNAQTTGGPDAAVVVVNYRTPELVERCLESVRATQGDLRLQVVVIDNASDDGSVERLRAFQPEATVIERSDNGGFAAGVNDGFRNCSADVVILLNPDTEVRPGALAALVARLRERPGTGVVAPLLEDGSGRLAPNGYRFFPSLSLLALDLCVPFGYVLSLLPWLARLHPYVLSPGELMRGAVPAWVSGAAMAIRRSAYEQAGPFDEGFFLYFEESEWQLRVAGCGWAVEVLPSARASHLMRGGGEDALVHSPHFLTSAIRYLRMRGVPVAVSRAVLSVSLALSWVTLELIALLPSKHAHATGQARAYGSLLHDALVGGAAR